MELICTNGKRDSGTKLTSPELCEPFTQTVNRTITDTHSTENLTCLNWDFDMSPFSSAPLWSNFESIAIHNCTGISQTRTYSPTCKRKIDSRKGAWEEGTQRPAARIQRRDWPRVWEFPPSFESTCVHRVWVEGNRRCWCHHSLRFFLPALLISRKERKILGTRNVSKIFKYNLQCLAIN